MTAKLTSLSALRVALKERLVATGGRPRLRGAQKQHKVPVDTVTWEILQHFAKTLRSDTMKPAAGQIASLLISDQIEQLIDEGLIAGPPGSKKGRR
jgi:hypothetical protein